MTRTEIEKVVRDAMTEVTGLNNFTDDDSLIYKNMGIFPADFLYIFNIVEKKLELPVCDILAYTDFKVMTVKYLAVKLYHTNNFQMQFKQFVNQ